MISVQAYTFKAKWGPADILYLISKATSLTLLLLLVFTMNLVKADSVVNSVTEYT